MPHVAPVGSETCDYEGANRPIFYIIDVSTATRERDGRTLRAILKTSRETNAIHGITGLLFYKEGRFLQLLEGDEADEIEFTEAALSAHSSRALELLRLFRDHM